MLVRTWAVPAGGSGLNAGIGDEGNTLGAGREVPQGLGLLTKGFRLLGAGLAPSFQRLWTIGQLADDYGYHAVNAYGGLVSNEWFNYIDTVGVLIVDDSSNAAIFQANNSSMWGIANEVTLVVEGFGQIVLTWNGATSYINVGDAAFVAYVVSQLGNSIGLSIFPLNITPRESINIITTLLDPEVTTVGDNITHTGV